MSPRFLTFLVVASFFAPHAGAGQGSTPNSGAWSGTIVYSSCNADEAFNESPECFRAATGAKFVEGETIHVTSLELMSIGLAVGQKAPALSLHDQFGRTQTLDSLQGANGTVLLFFRSADW